LENSNGIIFTLLRWSLDGIVSHELSNLDKKETNVRKFTTNALKWSCQKCMHYMYIGKTLRNKIYCENVIRDKRSGKRYRARIF
jgi:hypothetical protein